jgi:GMP synthase-like glutamine amidotransferase
MRVHVIQHVTFEGPAAITRWADDRGHQLTTGLAPFEEYPPVEETDLLVIMGGPMAADDETSNPWLLAEKHFIATVISSGRPVLGICLGSQILAEVLGGRVKRNDQPEIGWFDVERTIHGAEEPLFSGWEEPVCVGQWHSDTFELPLGIEPVLSSAACRNQAFVFDGRVVGLQFHLEWTKASLEQLISECSDEFSAWNPMIQTPEKILRGAHFEIPGSHAKLCFLLDGLAYIGAGAAGDGGPVPLRVR